MITQKNKLLVLITVFIIGGVFVLPARVYSASQAALFFSPGQGTFLVGSTFDLSLVLDTKGQSINTAEVEVLFPRDKIQLASPSVGQSIIQLWPAPPSFSNSEGRIYFIGGIPNPGIITSDGIVLTLKFRVVSPGDAEIKFGSHTSVLANDGKGTDILGQKPSAFFKFLIPPPLGPAISSPTHPDQEKWYRDNNPTFVWSRGSFANIFSYSIDRDPSGVPDTVSEGSASTASFNNLDNGIWYFHLRAGNDGTWGGVSSYVVKIDNQPPAAFTVNVSPSTRTNNRNPIFRFFTTDALSGFSHFEMKIIRLSGGNSSEALFYEISSPYQAINIEPGRYQVVVRAYDNALNARDENVSINILGPLSTLVDSEGIDLVVFFLPWSLLVNILFAVLIIFLIVIFMLWRQHKHHLKHAFIQDIGKFFIFAKNVAQKIRRRPPSLPIIILIIAGLYLLSPRLIEAKTVEPPAPVISVAPSQFYPLDEILYMEGRAAPKSKVAVNFEKPDAKSVTIIVESNSNGEWFLGQKIELSSGEWTARARVLSDPASDWSNPRIIQSKITGFIFGGLKIRYLPIVFTLLILIIFSIILLVYSLIKARNIKRLALEEKFKEKEKQTSQIIVGRDFADIRKKIVEELEHFDGMSKKHSLSPREQEHRNELMKQLYQIEEEIKKNLGGGG